MKAIKYIPTEIDIEITDISLLTVEEAENLPENIRQYIVPWWLCSSGGHSYDAAYVSSYGYVSDSGIYVNSNYIGVRPALKIKNMQFLNIGDIVRIKDKRYIIISENQLLYDDEIIYSRFDADSGDYEKSEIKEIVDKWLD